MKMSAQIIDIADILVPIMCFDNRNSIVCGENSQIRLKEVFSTRDNYKKLCAKS